MSNRGENGEKDADTMLRLYARYGAVGLQMAALMVVCILAGHWVDGRLGWRFPACTLVMVFVGLAGAIWLLFRETRRLR